MEQRSILVQRFWSKVKIGTPESCWEWTGSKTGTMGYGSFALNGKATNAHRAYWIMTHGPLDRKMFVCHKCDNPPCVNPSHLFTGTALDNIRDCKAKGRLNKHETSKTHCPRKHKYNKKNTFITKKGFRLCLPCDRLHKIKFTNNHPHYWRDKSRARRARLKKLVS